MILVPLLRDSITRDEVDFYTSKHADHVYVWREKIILYLYQLLIMFNLAVFCKLTIFA